MPQKLKSNPLQKNKPLHERLNLPVAFALKNALILDGRKGFPLELLLAQAANESGGFNSDNGNKEFNFGGIKWTERMKILKPSSIFLAPAKEDRKRRRIPYVKFKDMNQYAHYWPITASLDTMIYDNRIGPPLEAKTLEEFAHRVTLNHYSQKSEAEYLAGLKIWDSIIKRELLQNPARTMVPDIPTNNNLDLSAYIKRHVMVSDKTKITLPFIKNNPFAPARKKASSLINNVNNLFGFSAIQDMQSLAKPDGIKKAANAKKNEMRHTLLHKDKTNMLMNYTGTDNKFSFNNSLNLRPAWAGKSFDNYKVNKEWSLLSTPVNAQSKKYDSLHGNKTNDRPAVNIHVNTPLIGQLTIHANSAKDGINDLRAKVEEALLQVLSSSGSMA